MSWKSREALMFVCRTLKGSRQHTIMNFSSNAPPVRVSPGAAESSPGGLRGERSEVGFAVCCPLSGLC